MLAHLAVYIQSNEKMNSKIIGIINSGAQLYCREMLMSQSLSI